MYTRKYRLWLSVLILTVFLAGCGTPMPPETQPANQDDLLATMVAATVEAALDTPPLSAATEIPTSAPTLPAPQALMVAYIKDGNVYVWTEGGGSVGLTGSKDATRVSISDDGRMIAYVRQNPNNVYATELWVVNTSGPTQVRILVTFQELENLKAASPFASASGLTFDKLEWQPNTHLIAYSTVPFFEGPGYAPSEDLRTINVDTLERTTIFDFGAGGMFTFSPDGTQVALSSPDHISLANADGSNLRANVLTYPPVGTYSEYQYRPNPIWAADSSSLRVVIPPEDTLANPLPPSTLWLIPVDGSPASQLGTIQAMPFDWPDDAFAPDFAHVAYARSIGQTSTNLGEIHVANGDGSDDFVFAAGFALRFEGWTPDSARFVYSSTGGGNDGVFLANISGGISTITSAPNTISQMRWVDASRFLYFGQSGSAWELRISDVDGTNHAFIDTLSDADTYGGYDFVQ